MYVVFGAVTLQLVVNVAITNIRVRFELQSDRAQLVVKLFDGTWVCRKGAAPASKVTARDSGKPPW